jgi:hypothetical protein
MTELDKVLAEIGQLKFIDQQLKFIRGQEITIGAWKIRPQTNGLMVTLRMVTSFGVRYHSVGLLKPGQERLKLLRELAVGWETWVAQRSRPGDNALINKLRKAEATQPVSQDIESLIQHILGGKVDASKLVHARNLKMIRQAFQQIRSNITFEDVKLIWDEVEVERIHNS